MEVEDEDQESPNQRNNEVDYDTPGPMSQNESTQEQDADLLALNQPSQPEDYEALREETPKESIHPDSQEMDNDEEVRLHGSQKNHNSLGEHPDSEEEDNEEEDNEEAEEATRKRSYTSYNEEEDLFGNRGISIRKGSPIL